MTRTRLDKLVAHARGWTRGSASRHIRDGRVTIDGQVQRDAATIVIEEAATVAVDGEPLGIRGRVVLMMNKPAGVVCATEDASDRTVLEVLSAELHHADLRIVGRLDKETTGLLLLTNDGELLHRLTHPRHHVSKQYLASYEGELDEPERRFAEGLELADGTICKPARFAPDGPGRARITLAEGRYHQVRRMVAACGGRVTALHRERIGGLELDPTLGPGECRRITEGELAAVSATAQSQSGTAS